MMRTQTICIHFKDLSNAKKHQAASRKAERRSLPRRSFRAKAGPNRHEQAFLANIAESEFGAPGAVKPSEGTLHCHCDGQALQVFEARDCDGALAVWWPASPSGCQTRRSRATGEFSFVFRLSSSAGSRNDSSYQSWPAISPP